MNDETRKKIPEEVKFLSVPDKHFDSHTQTHHIVTGETNQTSQTSDFFAVRTVTPLEMTIICDCLNVAYRFSHSGILPPPTKL